MGLNKPFKRIWRPLKGYDSMNEIWSDDTISPSLNYLKDDKFAPQLEVRSLLTSANLLITDLYSLFNYVEPNDSNLKVYSHRLYELFLRIATEFESNCKSILAANNYNTEKCTIKDYFKLEKACRLSEYTVVFERWDSKHVFIPFNSWKSTSLFTPLNWYQDYNKVKHNRYQYFDKANLENVMNAISALLCVLHSQVGGEMDIVGYNRMSILQTSESKVENDTFTIITPSFPEPEHYDFIWDNIKNESDPVTIYPF